MPPFLSSGTLARFNPLARAVATALPLLSLPFALGSAHAADGEIRLKEVSVGAATDIPVQERTELGRLTEATPMAGSVVTRETIETVQYLDALRELTGRVPGMSMVRNMRIPDGGKNYTDVRIDGLRSSYSQNWSLADQVNTINVDSIEFTNGPGSALYSSYAVGGTINVISRDPPKDFQGRISQEAGDYRFRRTQGSVGGVLGAGAVGYLISANDMNYDGPRANNTASQSKSGATGTLLIRPSESSKLTLSYDKFDWSYRLPGFITQKQFTSDWMGTMAGNYGRTDYDSQMGKLRYQVFLDDKTQVNLAYAQRSITNYGYGSGGSGGSWQTVCDNVTVICKNVNGGSSAVTNTIVRGTERNDALQAVLRRDFDWAQGTLYAGVDFTDSLSDSSTYNNRYNALAAQQGSWGLGTLSSAGSRSKEKDRTPFLNYEFSPWERVRFHLGERFDSINYQIVNRATPSQGGDKSYARNVFKGGVTYDLNASNLLWANYSQGFLAPAVSTLVGSTTTVPNMGLLPEEHTTRELGIRGKNAELGVRYDLALYHSTIRNIIVSRDTTAAEKLLYGAAYTTLNENAGVVIARGVEAQAAWRANSWFELAATLTVASAMYDQYLSGTGAGRTDLSGHSYQAMPNRHLNLRGIFTPLPRLRVELEGDYLSRYYLDTANTTTYQRPTLFHLRTQYEFDKDWSAWLHIRNLGNVHYADRVSITTINGVSQVAYGTLGNSGTFEPLTLRVGVAYKF